MHDPTRPDYDCVLLADDDEDWRCLVAGALRTAGMDVQEASDGHELLFQLAVLKLYGRSTVVLSDIHMPRACGKSAWQQARELAPEVPFLFVTGASDSALAAEVRAEGGTVIGKTVSPSALAGMVRRLGPNAVGEDATRP